MKYFSRNNYKTLLHTSFSPKHVYWSGEINIWFAVTVMCYRKDETYKCLLKLL